MLGKFSTDLSDIMAAMQQSLLFSLKILAILWAIHIFNFFIGYRFNQFGIRTRSFRGIPGIFFAPVFHGDFNHLFFNSIPLVILSSLILVDGKPLFYQVSLSIVVLSGLFTLLFGRRGIHIGASGVIMGYFGYLLAKAYFNPSGIAIILAALCIYYCGSLITSVFPGAKKNISWDGHLFGMASGILVACFPQMLAITRFIT